MEFIIEFLAELLPIFFLYEEENKEFTKKGKIALYLSVFVTICSVGQIYCYFQGLGLPFAIIGFALTCVIIFALLKVLNNKKKLGISLSIIYVIISAILLYMSKEIIDLSQLITFIIEFILIIVICLIDINK